MILKQRCLERNVSQVKEYKVAVWFVNLHLFHFSPELTSAEPGHLNQENKKKIWTIVYRIKLFIHEEKLVDHKQLSTY